MSEIGSEFAQRFISARQGFHEFVEDNRETDPNIADKEQIIVDINISGVHNPTDFESFTDIEREYSYLEENLTQDEQNHDIVRQNIEADQTMLAVLQGREVDPHEFMMKVAGHMPEADPDDEINKRIKELDERYQLLGLRYDEEGAAAYNERYVLRDSESIRTVFEKSIQLGRVATESFVEVSIDLITPEFVNDSNIPWSGYLTSDEKGKFSLIANIDPSKVYTEPAIARWMLHEEGGHHVQIKGLWEKAIREGRMSPAIGLTSMTSPLNTYAEIAPYIAEKQLKRVYPELSRSEDAALHAEIEDMYGELFTMVTHRAIVKAIQGIGDKEAIASEAHECLPREPRERIDSLVDAVISKPTYRAAFAAYGYIRQLMDGLTSAEHSKLIKGIYSEARTLEQTESLVRQHKESAH